MARIPMTYIVSLKITCCYKWQSGSRDLSASADLLVAYATLCQHVYLSVCCTPVLYRNGCTDRVDFLHTRFPWLTNATLYFREIRVSAKIKVFFSGTLKISPRHTDRRREQYKQRQWSTCCWQHLGTKADVASVVYSRRRLPTVDRTRRAAQWSIGCEASSRGSRQYELIYLCGWRRIIVFAHSDGQVIWKGLKVTIGGSTGGEVWYIDLQFSTQLNFIHRQTMNNKKN